MDNDLIRQQIESAKKSFVSTKTKQNDRQFSMANVKHAGTVTDLSRIEQQAQIMTRLKSLMDEAAKTPRQDRQMPQPEDGHSRPRESAPFWAQKQHDIPPSERFANQQREQESKMADTPPSTSEQTAVPSEQASQTPQPVMPEAPATDASAMPDRQVSPPAQPPAMPPKPSNEDALSAIRSEVFSHMEKAPIPAELLERIEQIEQRANQQQQDLTAVLKLVRQLASSQKEMEAGNQPKGRGVFATMLFSVLVIIGLICVGAIGWLYVMNPDWMNSIFTQLINTIFSQTIHLISLVAGIFGLEM